MEIFIRLMLQVSRSFNGYIWLPTQGVDNIASSTVSTVLTKEVDQSVDNSHLQENPIRNLNYACQTHHRGRCVGHDSLFYDYGAASSDRRSDGAHFLFPEEPQDFSNAAA